MNILFITSKFPRWPGDPQPAFTFYLARELVRRKHKVTVIAPHHKGAENEGAVLGIKVYRFSYFWPRVLQRFAYGAGIPANVRKSILARLQAPAFALAEIRKAKKVAAQLNPDVVHAHWALPQGLAAKATGKKYIVTVYGGEVFLSRQFRMIALLDWIIRESFKSYALTTGLRQIMKEFGVTAHLGVMPLGVDTDVFKPALRGSEAVKRKFCPNNELMVLCVGRLVEKKGIEYLIHAFRELKDELKNVKLVIVGDGYLYDHLTGLSKELRLQKDIVFTKEINHEHLPKYYCAADLFVLPSIVDSKGNRETQGVVYLEAMACRTAVIGTDTGGIPDVISSKQVGVLVPQKDPRKLARAMVSMLSDNKKRSGYAQHGYDHVHKHFTWPIIAERYIKVYESALR
jgi:glycosyltransferase involved in cell wall biosynthesis